MTRKLRVNRLGKPLGGEAEDAREARTAMTVVAMLSSATFLLLVFGVPAVVMGVFAAGNAVADWPALGYWGAFFWTAISYVGFVIIGAVSRGGRR